MKCEIKPLFDEKLRSYSIADFNNVKQALVNELKDAPIELIVNDDEDLKFVRQYRTTIRKQKKTITDTRLAINRLLLDKFNTQLKDLETIINEVDLKLQEKVDTYNAEKKAREEAQVKVVEPKTFSIVVVSLNKEDLDKVIAFANELKCQVIKQ